MLSAIHPGSFRVAWSEMLQRMDMKWQAHPVSGGKMLRREC